ncbi:MAG: prolyl oligopeptidase family serine peptidase [bacterium]
MMSSSSQITYRFKSVKRDFLVILCHTFLMISLLTAAVFGWPLGTQTARIQSSLDGAIQRAKYWVPQDVPEPVPLLVGLHTWSGDYDQSSGDAYLAECRTRGWAFIHPDFRGPNTRPEACGSELALTDIRDAVVWMQEQTQIDPDRIYLVGVSGGGHAALMAAARWPTIWAAVSAWAPPTDLAAWYRETKAAGHPYWQHLSSVCGGAPGENQNVDREYETRSPVYQLHRAAGVRIEIAEGIRDGYDGSVPVSHTLHAFNVLACANGFESKQIPENAIEEIVQTIQIPENLVSDPLEDSTYTKAVLFRRAAGPVRVTLFQGGHEILVPAAITWLAQFDRKSRPSSVH